mmetsp:Transcript_10277/g.42493  ORF Transcript_10277/g.42493 Transcript_10277/m.42493 type:complete len:219 (+) Transcript_10277:551-1207(+)
MRLGSTPSPSPWVPASPCACASASSPRRTCARRTRSRSFPSTTWRRTGWSRGSRAGPISCGSRSSRSSSPAGTTSSSSRGASATTSYWGARSTTPSGRRTIRPHGCWGWMWAAAAGPRWSFWRERATPRRTRFRCRFASEKIATFPTRASRRRRGWPWSGTWEYRKGTPRSRRCARRAPARSHPGPFVPRRRMTKTATRKETKERSAPTSPRRFKPPR